MGLIRPRLWPVAAVAALAAVAFVIATADSRGAKRSDAEASKRVSVAVRDDFFRPRSKRIRRGDTVVWRWRGDNPHNVRFRKVPRGVSRRGSRTQTSGRFSRRFRKRGTYRYVCTIHEDLGMRGSLRVK